MIVQLVGDIRTHNVISSTALLIHKKLCEQGIQAAICAGAYDHEEQKDLVSPLFLLNDLSEDDIVILHFGTLGFNYVREFAQTDCTKVLYFYGMIDPGCFEIFNTHLGNIYKGTLRQLSYLSNKVDIVFSVSEWEDNELDDAGFMRPYMRCMPHVSSQEICSSDNLGTKLFEQSGTNVLTYGDVMPNRNYEDMLRAFCCYQKAFDRNAKLCIIGSFRIGDPYYRMLQSLIKVNALYNVIFLSETSLLESCCDLASIFISQSASEIAYQGFFEAMKKEVPIIAYETDSVKSIVGDAGLLLREKDPFLTASTMDYILHNERLYSSLCKLGQRRACQLSDPDEAIVFIGKVIEAAKGVRNVRKQ